MTGGILELPLLIKCSIALGSSLSFLYLRTLNVRYIAKDHLLGTLVSGALVNITWGLSTALGISGLTNWEPLLFFSGTIGGLIGTGLAMISKRKKVDVI